MSPLAAIGPAQPIYDFRPQNRIAIPDLSPGIEGPLPIGNPTQISPARTGAESFENVLGRMVQEVNAKQGAAADAVAGLQAGQNVSLHQAVIAMEEANVSFQLMVEVRNKLLESYQELMRMQI